MIEYEVRGGEETYIRIRAYRDRLRDEILEALKDAAQTAEKVMLAKVPRDSGALASTIHVSGIQYMPGGAGGGGAYEIVLHAGQGIPYLNLVTEGTGIHGPYNSYGNIVAGAGNIRPKVRPEWAPRTGARFMVFTPKGETKPIFRKWVRGQEPQTEWIVAAQQVANAIVAEHVRSMDLSRGR